ncbi:hypothetical protein HQR03_12815 [Psychrobacter okhotskensis]|uniref:hypothetical protein n=1 Tax=Psychrobacter okhotskensis TaxID=212403 RepID=UPI0015658D97|nr:hypothetical protein [Psychrobacter okhotskensis]NRD71414.1 hypothetical protein [Psychrobacter okhotskensis]
MRLNKKLIKYIVIPNMLFAISSLLGCMHTNSSNKIFLNNQTSFTLYTSKFETEDSDTEITLEEMESEKRIVLDVNEKDLYYVSNYALLADFPVDIDIGWHVTDMNIDGKPAYKGQGRTFSISEKGFCSYEIDIYDTHTEVRGIEGESCDKKIILNKGL